MSFDSGKFNNLFPNSANTAIYKSPLQSRVNTFNVRTALPQEIGNKPSQTFVH